MRPVDRILERLDRVKRSGKGWIARCPAHEDRHPSLSVCVGANGRVLLHCFAGCDVQKVVTALGFEMADLYPGTRTIPPSTRATVQHRAANASTSLEFGDAAGDQERTAAPLHVDQEGLRALALGCTLEAYARKKRLPEDFLRSLGLSDGKYGDLSAVRMPYVDGDGHERAIRYRISLDGEDRFRWKGRSKLCLYGLPRLAKAHELGYVVLVEGESCTQTLWYHGFPALGLPGAANWKDERDLVAVESLDTLYVVIEPDRGGQAIINWLGASALTTGKSPSREGDGPTETIFERVTDFAGRTFDEWREEPVEEAKPSKLPVVKLVTLAGAKDASELYLQDPAEFVARFEEALQAAIPYEEHERIAAGIRARAAWEKAGSLAKEPRILDVLEQDLDGAGVVGERHLCKLIYLSVTGRFLDRFPSLVIKGPSASGKSWVIERVLGFFPPEAYYVLTAMSERALAYGTESLRHRFLVLFEAAGLESDFASYLVRSLLSEGCLRYETVEKTKDGELTARLVQRDGPTGLIVSTTSIALHPENETRLLSLTATDTPDQTKLVLSRLADEDLDEPDLARWHDLQIWLASAEHRVSIPYGSALAELVSPVAVRLRRDFRSLLSLIRSHALLHQASRDRDAAGRVVATLEDYEIVHELVLDVITEGVDATVSSTVRETVAAVSDLLETSPNGISVSALARHLELDKSSVSRRARTAASRGYLRNEEERRGKSARYVLGDALPEEIQLLPTRHALEGRADGAPSPSTPAAHLLGDSTFREYINDACKRGHITRSEQFERIRLHDMIIRGRSAAGEKVIQAEAAAPIEQGALFDPGPPKRTPDP